MTWKVDSARVADTTTKFTMNALGGATDSRFSMRLIANSPQFRV